MIRVSAAPKTGPDFESAEFAVASGAVSAAHGLGAIPSRVELVMRCKVAEYGYAVGDEVYITNGSASTDACAFADAANVGAAIAGTSAINNIPNKSTGAGGAVTGANWRVVLRAWK